MRFEEPTEEESAEYNRLGKKLGRILTREKTSLETGLNTLSGLLLTNIAVHLTENDEHAAALALVDHYTQVAEYYKAKAGGMKCDGCQRDFSNEVQMGPILRDDVWQKFAKPNEILCEECVYNRSLEQREILTIASLEPCPFNLAGGECSYYNLFMSCRERTKTKLSADVEKQWRQAIEIRNMRFPGSCANSA